MREITWTFLLNAAGSSRQLTLTSYSHKKLFIVDATRRASQIKLLSYSITWCYEFDAVPDFILSVLDNVIFSIWLLIGYTSASFTLTGATAATTVAMVRISAAALAAPKEE